jgi:RNA polymerase sigma-70 factor, ECF subfamily
VEEYLDLVAGAKAGDEAALTALYRANHPALVRYLHAHVPGEEEDLASDVWLDVARGLDRFEGDEQDFRRLVFTIARRRAIDHGRMRARRRTDPTDVAAMAELAGAADPESVVVEGIAGEEAVDRIRALLGPEQAEVVLLRTVAGLSVGEVAEILGRQPAAISVIQHRALRRLARALDPAPEEILAAVKDP